MHLVYCSYIFYVDFIVSDDNDMYEDTLQFTSHTFICIIFILCMHLLLRILSFFIHI